MRNTDPAWHKARQQEMVGHLTNLLKNPAFTLDTVAARRSPANLEGTPTLRDRAGEIKQLMIRLGSSDAALQARLPLDPSLEVEFIRRRFWIFEQPMAWLKLLTVAPTAELIKGTTPAPLTASEVRKLVSEHAPSPSKTPTTLVIASTGGFAPDAREAVERAASRTVVLIEPNAAGGWTVHGPSELRAMCDLLDPEPTSAKLDRLTQMVEARRGELLSGPLSAKQLAEEARLPIALAEQTFRTYASKNPDLESVRENGVVVLYRKSLATRQTSENDMPIFERFKNLFRSRDDVQSKIAVMERKIAAETVKLRELRGENDELQKRVVELEARLDGTDNPTLQRSIASEIADIEDDLKRKQQRLSELQKKLEVLKSHRHNLERTLESGVAGIPSVEEIQDAAAEAESAAAELGIAVEIARDATGNIEPVEDERTRAVLERARRRRQQTSDEQPGQADPSGTLTEPAETVHPPPGSSVHQNPAAVSAKRSEPEPG